MTTTMSIDTLQFFENLKKAGMQENIAKVLVEEFKEIQEINVKHLATKADVKAIEERLEQKIDSVEERLEQKIQTLEYKLLTKIGAMLMVSVAAVTWLNKIIT